MTTSASVVTARTCEISALRLHCTAAGAPDRERPINAQWGRSTRHGSLAMSGRLTRSHRARCRRGAAARRRRHSAAGGTRHQLATPCFAAALCYLRSPLADTRRRRKICRDPRCGVAFYDRSRNNNGVWHDLKTCGNAANLRSCRARSEPIPRPEPSRPDRCGATRRKCAVARSSLPSSASRIRPCRVAEGVAHQWCDGHGLLEYRQNWLMNLLMLLMKSLA